MTSHAKPEAVRTSNADRLQAAWDSYAGTKGELALPPITFTEAEADHILAALAQPTGASTEGAAGREAVRRLMGFSSSG